MRNVMKCANELKSVLFVSDIVLAGECLHLHYFVGYGPNSDSAAAAAAVAKRDASRAAGETDTDGQTDKTDNVIGLLRIGTIIKDVVTSYIVYHPT